MYLNSNFIKNFDQNGNLSPYILNEIEFVDFVSFVKSFNCERRILLLKNFNHLLKRLSRYFDQQFFAVIYGSMTRNIKVPKDLDVVFYLSPSDFKSFIKKDVMHDIINEAFYMGIEIYSFEYYVSDKSSHYYMSFKDNLEDFKKEHLCVDKEDNQAGALVIPFVTKEQSDAGMQISLA